MTEFTLNNEQVRIRRFDDKNLVIERLTNGLNKKGKPITKWRRHGYYGKVRDVIGALINLSVVTPEGDNLSAQLDNLSQQLAQLETRLGQQLEVIA